MVIQLSARTPPEVEPFLSIGEIFENTCEEIARFCGDPGTGKVGGVRLRTKWRYSCIWFIEGVNYGFAIDILGIDYLYFDIQTHGHDGDLMNAQASVRTPEAVKGMLPKLLPLPLKGQI